MKTIFKSPPRRRVSKKAVAKNGAVRHFAQNLADPALKDMLKQAIAETLVEHPNILRQAVTDAWEDTPEAQAAFVRWIKEGENTPEVSREEIFAVLEAKA